MIISKVMLNSCNICAHKKGYRYRKWVRHYLPWFFSNICFQKTLYCLEQIFKLLLKFLLILFLEGFYLANKRARNLVFFKVHIKIPENLLVNSCLGNFRRYFNVCSLFMIFASQKILKNCHSSFIWVWHVSNFFLAIY